MEGSGRTLVCFTNHRLATKCVMIKPMRARILLAVLTMMPVSGCDSKKCPGSCPAAFMGTALDVTSAADGGALSGVEASLGGWDMQCEVSRQTITVCWWPSGLRADAGSYSLVVTAPGFQSANVSADVTIHHDSQCGCDWATINPSNVTLEPCPAPCSSDAGVCSCR